MLVYPFSSVTQPTRFWPDHLVDDVFERCQHAREIAGVLAVECDPCGFLDGHSPSVCSAAKTAPDTLRISAQVMVWHPAFSVSPSNESTTKFPMCCEWPLRWYVRPPSFRAV